MGQSQMNRSRPASGGDAECTTDDFRYFHERM
jgi:hypothetical protein